MTRLPIATYEIIAGKFHLGWVDEIPQLRETRRAALQRACVRYARILRDLGTEKYTARGKELYRMACRLRA